MRAEALYGAETGYHRTQLEVSPEAFALIAAERARKIAAWMNPGDAIFEFGVGTGLNLALLGARRRVGYDVASHLASGLERRGIEFCAQLDEPRLAGSFDILLLHHALEHVVDPAQTISRLQPLLRDGGRMLIYVPFEREPRYRAYCPDEPNHHLFSWNCQTLGNLVAVLDGWSVQSVELGPTGYERFLAGICSGLPATAYRLALSAARFCRPVEEICLVARKEPD